MDHHKRFKIARHECGHAIMALLCRHKVKSISLKEKDSPSGLDKYLGSMDLEPFQKNPTITINELNRKILISLAGFAGDGLYSDGLITNFGGDDLAKAIKWVENMLESESFRNFVARLPPPCPGTLKLIGNDLISRYIDHMMSWCFKILEPMKSKIQVFAEKLSEKEELTEVEVYTLAKQLGLDKLEFNVQAVFSGVT